MRRLHLTFSFGQMMKTISIILLMVILPCFVLAQQKEKAIFSNPFNQIEINNNFIMARLPDSGIRWIIKRDSKKEVSTYGQVLQLKDGDVIILLEKHTRYNIQAEIREGLGFLHYTCIIDARFSGEDIKSASGTIEVKKRD